MIRTALAALTLLVVTPPLAAVVAIAAALRVENRSGGIYDWCSHCWARALLWAAGARVVVHGAEKRGDGEARIILANHVSWYDVFALASVVPRYRFVAKAELMHLPIFGRGALAVGTIPISRENRNSAFQSYKTAGERVREGTPVIVFPEGTRGEHYPLRQFKKGPFVLAIASGVPIVPTLVYGANSVMPRRGFHIRSGQIDVHFLDPVPTAGLDYEDRDRLAEDVRRRIATAMLELYGVESPNAGVSAAGGPRAHTKPVAPRLGAQGA